jgi:hypothetical protein
MIEAIETTDTGSSDEVRVRMQEIARAEIQRQRGRMDSFTPEQAKAIEALLVATANEISLRITQRIERYPAELRSKCLQVWAARAA